MAINNQPTIKPQTVTGAFTRYMAKTIPLAFDESMSYYECLCALRDYINTYIENINNVNEGLAELQEFYLQLQEYVNNYFNNLDVQEEINKKLDDMAASGELNNIISEYISLYVEPQINTQNNKISQLETKINSVTSGSPLVASSTAGMTDTTRVYVNSTDGKWYYYDGDSWEIGGTYQSSGLDTNSVHFNNLDATLDTMLFRESSDVSNLGLIRFGGADSSHNITSYIYLKKGTTITVSEEFIANYEWKIMEVIGVNSYINLFTFTTDTSYVMNKDALCVIAWEPLDHTWNNSQYDVNRYHHLDNNDITSITYYFPKFTENFLLEDLDGSFINASLAFANQQKESNANPGVIHLRYSSRITLCKPFKSKYPTKCSIKNGYSYGVMLYENDGITLKTDSGWLTDDYIIPANTYFSFAYRKDDNSNFTDLYTVYHEKIFTLTSYCDIAYATQMINNLGTANYYYTGEKLETKNKYGFNIANLYQFDNKMTGGYSQGFDIKNNYLVQLYADTGIQLRNFTTNAVISNINLSGIGHGDTCQFSNTYYNVNDILPLLYVCTDTNPANVVVVRISNTTTAEIIQTINFDISYGYYAGECFDFDNNLIYVFGYKNSDYRTADNNNEMIISKYDMTTNTLLDRWNIPFIYVVQGQKFFKGKCILLSSGVYTEQTTRIYVYDPIVKQMVSVFDSFNSDILNGEQEDLQFVLNSSGSYDLIIGDRNYYRKLTFTNI